MKKQSNTGVWIVVATMVMLIFQIPAIAQDTLPATSGRVANWMQRNWLWIAGAILLIILLAATSSRPRSKKTITTIEKDELGNVKNVTTTKVEE